MIDETPRHDLDPGEPDEDDEEPDMELLELMRDEGDIDDPLVEEGPEVRFPARGFALGQGGTAETGGAGADDDDPTDVDLRRDVLVMLNHLSTERINLGDSMVPALVAEVLESVEDILNSHGYAVKSLEEEGADPHRVAGQRAALDLRRRGEGLPGRRRAGEQPSPQAR